MYSLFLKLFLLIFSLLLFFVFSFNVEVVSLSKFFFLLSFLAEEKMFIFAILTITFSVCFFSSYYMIYEKKNTMFFSILLLFVFSMTVLIFSSSSFLMFLGWEGLGFSSFFLICFYKNWESLTNSVITFFSMRIGDILLLLFFVLILVNQSMKKEFFVFLVFLLFLFYTKSAVFPFSSWLPAAMSAPTPVSALVHSSTLVTAGILLFKKVKMEMENQTIATVLLTFSVVTMLYSSILAYKEKDFKKIVALSTMSQISFMLFVFSFSMVYLSMFHLFMHAFFKSTLFFSVGGVLHGAMGMQDKRNYTKTFMLSNFNSFILILSLMSMSGLVFLSGFYSKELILEKYFVKAMVSSIFLMNLIFGLTMFYSFVMVKAVLSNAQGSKLKLETSEELKNNLFLSFLLTSVFGFFSANNLFIISEAFLFKEALFSYAFLFFLLTFLVVYKKYNKTTKKMFLLDVLTSSFSKVNYFKTISKSERHALESFNTLFYTKTVWLQGKMMKMDSLLLLLFIFLLFLL